MDYNKSAAFRFFKILKITSLELICQFYLKKPVSIFFKYITIMCKRANEWVFSSIFEFSSTVYLRKFQRYIFRFISSRKISANISERK